MLRIELIPTARADSDAPKMYLLLCDAQSADEACPITLQPIAAAEPTLGFRCAQLELCGHRFSVRPLLVFFASANMRCPLCRQGTATQRLSLPRTFPGEAWAEALQPAAAASDDDDEEEDMAFLQLGLEQRRFDAEIERLQARMPPMLQALITLSLAHHGNTLSTGRYPLHYRPFQTLRDLQTMRPRYMLCGDSLVALSQQIRMHQRRDNNRIEMSVRVEHSGGERVLLQLPPQRLLTDAPSFSALLQPSYLMFLPSPAQPRLRITSFVFIPPPPSSSHAA